MESMGKKNEVMDVSLCVIHYISVVPLANEQLKSHPVH